MTLTLELPPELEQRLQAEAQAQGQNLQSFALSLLEQKTPATNSLHDKSRKRRVLTGYGKFAGIGGTVDEFLEERHAEAEREEARFQRRYAQGVSNPTAPPEPIAPEPAA